MREDALLRGRIPNLALNGQLFDADGNIFDLTAWYKGNSVVSNNQTALVNAAILSTLKKIELHLSLISGEELNEQDPTQEDDL